MGDELLAELVKAVGAEYASELWAKIEARNESAMKTYREACEARKQKSAELEAELTALRVTSSPGWLWNVRLTADGPRERVRIGLRAAVTVPFQPIVGSVVLIGAIKIYIHQVLANLDQSPLAFAVVADYRGRIRDVEKFRLEAGPPWEFEPREPKAMG